MSWLYLLEPLGYLSVGPDASEEIDQRRNLALRPPAWLDRRWARSADGDVAPERQELQRELRVEACKRQLTLLAIASVVRQHETTLAQLSYGVVIRVEPMPLGCLQGLQRLVGEPRGSVLVDPGELVGATLVELARVAPERCGVRPVTIERPARQDCL